LEVEYYKNISKIEGQYSKRKKHGKIVEYNYNSDFMFICEFFKGLKNCDWVEFYNINDIKFARKEIEWKC